MERARDPRRVCPASTAYGKRGWVGTDLAFLNVSMLKNLDDAIVVLAGAELILQGGLARGVENALGAVPG